MAVNDTSNKLNSTTEQVGQTRDEKGRITGGVPPVGFHTNPENISPGGWKKENTISYQYNRFMNMTPEQLEDWAKNTSKSQRTVAMDLAYNRVVAAKKSLPDIKEITDRTEGKAPQSLDVTTGGEKLEAASLPDELVAGFSEWLSKSTKQ